MSFLKPTFQLVKDWSCLIWIDLEGKLKLNIIDGETCMKYESNLFIDVINTKQQFMR